MVERSIAARRVTGSNPVLRSTVTTNNYHSEIFRVIFLDSIVVSIPACHAGDPGSIPGRGVTSFFALPPAAAAHSNHVSMDVSTYRDAMVDRNHASVSSIVVSTSRCGRDIPGSNPGWRKISSCEKSQPGPKYILLPWYSFFWHAYTRHIIHIVAADAHRTRTDCSNLLAFLAQW